MATSTIRVMLVEDHTVVRQGLEALLRDEADIQVVAHAAEGREALDKAQKVRPDVVLLDISMPGMNGLDVARELRKTLPQTRVVVLTVNTDDEYVVQAFKCGASGYLVKDTDADSVIEAVRQVAAGHNYLTPFASRALIERVKTIPSEPSGGLEQLTEREKQIWKLIAQGKTSSQIGEKLEISVKTVQTHRNNLMNKLGIHDLTTLVKEAIRRGIVDLP